MMTRSSRTARDSDRAQARADGLAKAVFDLMATQPAPDHLVDLVDALEASRKAEAQAA